ncbi:extracellular solute-binding protein [Paenibacillus sp. GYB004]|uniref:ABC transporter substrate-binding protein n=1 Tax=Paenibacillus sp. GYB004 TaxID=2994393 RepID=UPI002F969287
MRATSFKMKGTALFLCSALLAAGCGGQQGGNQGGDTAAPPPVKKKDPYEMSIYAPGVSAKEFDDRWRKTLEAKFPHITFKYTTSGQGNSIAELVSRGEIPDLYRLDIPTIRTNYLDMGLAYDLRDLIKQYKYDMNRFNKVFTQEIIDVIGSGEVYGLPVPPYFPQVLYYNKDLFDKFGVPYPKDGMTLDEVYELAKKMSRSDGGTIYRGLSANTMAFMRDNPMSLPILDPKVDGLSGMDKWKGLFETLKRFYDIPNNQIAKTVADENNAFSKGNVAMQINQHNIYLIIPPEVNWDIVSAPLINGAPKMMGQRGPAYWAITNQSKHKEEAFEVMMEMLSDEIQMQDSKNGIPTTLVKKEIIDALGKDHPVYGTKNMKALTTLPPIPATPKRAPGLVDIALGTQQNTMSGQFQKVATNQMDINSALREADELLKKAIAAEKEKQGKK